MTSWIFFRTFGEKNEIIRGKFSFDICHLRMEEYNSLSTKKLKNLKGEKISEEN